MFERIRNLFQRSRPGQSGRMIQRCHVYMRRQQIIVVSTGSVEQGGTLTRSAHPLTKLDRSQPPEDIGKAISAALAASVRPLAGRDLATGELEKYVDVRSWNTVWREFKILSVHAREGEITIQRQRAKPYIGTSVTMVVESEVKCASDPEAIGRAALESLDRPSETAPKATEHRVAKVKTKWAGGLSWLAIRTDDEAAVIKALKSNGIRAAICTETKSNAASSVGVFSPEPGWTLAIGGGILPDTEKPDLVPFLKAMSIPLREVYWFANYRIVEYHAWAKAVNGEIVRGYAYLGESGEVSLNQGPLTPEEEAIGEEALEFPDDQMVFSLAKSWSVDPAIVIESIS